MAELYEESLKAEVGRIKRQLESDQAKDKLFNRTLGIAGKRRFTSKELSTKEINKLHELENIMRTTEKFSDYIRAYKHFEHIVGMPHATIIYSISYNNKGKKSSVTVTYSSQEKHITVPNKGVPLYHKSPAKFSELHPTFRGKQTGEGVSRGGYLYDSSRVYLSLTDKMPKFAADLKSNVKYHLYKIKENLNNLIVDPAFNSPNLGAVYVNTNLPIKVDEVTEEDIKKAKEKEKTIKTAAGAAIAGAAVGAIAASALSKNKNKAKETKERVEDLFNSGVITESDKNLYLDILDAYDIE